MKLVLFGANGGAGRLLTRQLLDGGHDVTAVTRRPQAFPLTDPRLTIAEADVRDRDAVARAVRGAEAVASTLGVPFTIKAVDTYSVGLSNITTAMRNQGIRRLVVTSSAGGYHYPNRRNHPSSMKLFESIMRNTFGRSVYRDTRRMESVVVNSDLDWTLVRPSIMFDLPAPTNYVCGDVDPVGLFTARIDLADYLAALATTDTAIRERVIISTTENAPTFVQAMRTQSYKSPAA